jgi:nitrogen fixation/metabolism regulation signal transduction histidine kinase
VIQLSQCPSHIDGDGGPSVQGVTGGRVRADRRALSQAVMALLSNAVESAGASSVSVVRERAGDRLRVRIENPGRLPSDNPESLFSPRAAAPGKNWGMGLARARLNAADAGGTVTLSQEADRVTAILEIPEEPS